MLKKFAEQINEDTEVTSVVSEELEEIQASEDKKVSEEKLEEAKKSVKAEAEDEKSDDEEEMEEEADKEEDEDETVKESKSAKSAKSVKSEEDDDDDDDEEEDDDDDEEDLDEAVVIDYDGGLDAEDPDLVKLVKKMKIKMKVTGTDPNGFDEVKFTFPNQKAVDKFIDITGIPINEEDDEEEMDKMAKATKSEILAASMKMLKQANKESLYAGYQALKASSCGKMHEEAEDISVDVSEDVQALLSGSDAELSEEFKNKATTIFEAAVKAKTTEQLDAIEQSLKEDYEAKLEEARSELAEKVDGYLNYVVEEWVKENELAIERGIKTEIAEEFMAGLKNLFVENYIDVPEEKADLLDELATKSEDLEAKLNEEFEKNVEMKKELDAMKAKDVLSEACEGLTATQVEKMQGLAEGIEFETIDQYREKLETIKESYFPKVRATGAEKEDSNESELSSSAPLNETMSIYARTLSSMKK